MSVNIACSKLGCSNPVIGQCTGYKKACGRYYCHEHSSDTLCIDCAKQKVADEHTELERKLAQEHEELVNQEYLTLAEKVSKESAPIPKFEFQAKNLIKVGYLSFALGTILLILLIVIDIILGIINLDISQGIATLYRLSIAGAIVLMTWPFLAILIKWALDRSVWIKKEKQRKISERISEIEEEKTGFTQFYNTWVKQRQEEQAEKNKKALMGVLKVVGIIAMLILAVIASGGSDDDRRRRNE